MMTNKEVGWNWPMNYRIGISMSRHHSTINRQIAIAARTFGTFPNPTRNYIGLFNLSPKTDDRIDARRTWRSMITYSRAIFMCTMSVAWCLRKVLMTIIAYKIHSDIIMIRSLYIKRIYV